MKLEEYIAVFMGMIIIIIFPLLLFYFIDDIVIIIGDYIYTKCPNFINFLLDNPLLSSIYILGGLFIALFIISVIIVIIRAYKEIY